MKIFDKILSVMVLCGVLILPSTSFAETAEIDKEVSVAGTENFQQLDFWSRLRDKVFFGDDNDKNNKRYHKSHYNEDRHHHHEPPPPHHRHGY